MASTALATARHVNLSHGRLSSATRWVSLKALSWTNREIALLSERRSPVTMVSPALRNVAASPHASVITTGVPAAAASNATRLKDSYVEGMTTTFDSM